MEPKAEVRDSRSIVESTSSSSNRRRARVFFFVVAPFCSCPASLDSRKFFAVGPGCAKCVLFCCAPLGAATFRRGQSKNKNTTQGVFFAPAPRKGRGRRSPVPARGQSNKKHHPGCFFCCGPGERQGKEKPCWAPARGFSFPCLSPGPEQKENTLGGDFFFAAAPRGRSLTHCGPGWRCLPLAGVVFFFCCGPARTGVVFFFFAVAPPGRSLTHCGLGRFRQGPGGVLFCCGPAGSF